MKQKAKELKTAKNLLALTETKKKNYKQYKTMFTI